MRRNKIPHNNKPPNPTRGTKKTRRPRLASPELAERREQAKIRGLAAINRVRRGTSKSLSAAAKAEGTTVKLIRKLLPAALVKVPPGRPIRVRAADPYSAKVQILTRSGPISVIARGSRQRLLAAEHRKVFDLVLQNELPASALAQFRGKKIGGRELLTDYGDLRTQVLAGVLDQLDSLYVSPETSA